MHQGPDACSADTLEELRRVIEALPTMPKNIVDDARHEKVLSYVSAFIAQRDPTLMHTMLVEWDILGTFQACLRYSFLLFACLAPGQDYRVSCVALRILGYCLQYDTNSTTSVWKQLETVHPSILSFIIENTHGEEALVRYSCWFALQYAVKNDSGAQWLLSTGRCSDMVAAALQDTSTYVLTAACQFLVAIIENRSMEEQQFTAHDTLMNTLLESISLYKLIHTMMTDQESERNRVAGLEFLWMVTDSRSDRGTVFLQQSQLFFNYMDLLMDDSRLVRSRALDVLSILLESTREPLRILGKDEPPGSSMHLDKSEGQPLAECLNHLLEKDVLSLLVLTDSLKAVHVATGILDAMIKPLRQLSDISTSQFVDTTLATVLWIIQAMQDTTKPHDPAGSHFRTDTIVIPGHGKLATNLNQPGFQDSIRTHSHAKSNRGSGSRGGTLPKTIVLSALKALQSLALLFPMAVEKSVAINVVLSILFNQQLCSDQRVFKACLATLPIALKTKVQNGQLLDEQLFASVMKVILGLIKRPASGSTSLRLILTAILDFFESNTLGKILVNESVGQELASGLGLKLYDMEWDIRDNVVEFIGNLFVTGGPNHGVDWALKHDLLESIYQKLSDEEAYVRAASVHAFEIVMRDSRGWNGMCLKSLDKRLSGQLPALIRDSEAFVRRAVLDAMVCLVSERESGSILMVNGTDLFVDAKFMSRLTLDDADWEVRIRACDFISAVWEHCLALDEKADYRVRAAKRLKDTDSQIQEDAPPPRPSTWWFYDIKGDQILVEATQDSSRMVRLASVEALKKIKASIEARLDASHEDIGGYQSFGDHGEEELQRKRSAGAEERSTAILSKHVPQQHPHAAFYAVLLNLDFERLDATTSVERLYEEVLNVERVEDVVMAESEKPNDGNNVLDCY
ncbi:BRCA1-associated ATM activator 1 [Mortierella alpina]|nr:BRCA1-associated ATM activator 1 [Mortierella alpina]